MKAAYKILAARPGRVYIGHGYGEASQRYPMAAIVAPSPEEALRMIVEWIDASPEEKAFIRAVGAGLDPMHADREFSSKLPAEMRFLRVEVTDAKEKYLDEVPYGTLISHVCDYYAISRPGAGFRANEGHWVDEEHEVFRLTAPAVGVAYNCGRPGHDVRPGLYKRGYHGSPGAAGIWWVIGE